MKLCSVCATVNVSVLPVILLWGVYLFSHQKGIAELILLLCAKHCLSIECLHRPFAVLCVKLEEREGGEVTVPLSF